MLPQKKGRGWGGGVWSDLNTKPDMDGQSHLTIQYTSQASQKNFELDAMNNPRKSISGDTLV
jgi:hypothetical protein